MSQWSSVLIHEVHLRPAGLARHQNPSWLEMLPFSLCVFFCFLCFPKFDMFLICAVDGEIVKHIFMVAPSANEAKEFFFDVVDVVGLYESLRCGRIGWYATLGKETQRDARVCFWLASPAKSGFRCVLSIPTHIVVNDNVLLFWLLCFVFVVGVGAWICFHFSFSNLLDLCACNTFQNGRDDSIRTSIEFSFEAAQSGDASAH
jgi:hypothetical protein